jgi:exonuclease V gamma subunit
MVKDAMNDKSEKKAGGSVVVKNHLISGAVDGVFENSVVEYCHSSSIYSSFIEAYIRYVFTRASGHELNFVFLYQYKKRANRFAIDSSQISQEKAMTLLDKWVDYYIKGHESLFHFYPKFSDPLGYVADDYNHFISSCEKDIFNSFSPKKPDEHFVIAYENGYLDEEHFESFKENTNSILGATNFKP